jgi:hypothetical protein
MMLKKTLVVVVALALSPTVAFASLMTNGAGGLYNPNSRAIFFPDNNIPFGLPLIFTNATDACNMFGTNTTLTSGLEICDAADQFFSGSSGSGAEMVVDRIAYGRARIFGANIEGTLSSIQQACGTSAGSPSGSAGPCSLSFTYRGITYSYNNIDLYKSGAVTSIGTGTNTSCTGETTTVCGVLETQINDALPVQVSAGLSGTITSGVCSFTAQITAQVMTVTGTPTGTGTAASTNCIIPGGYVSGSGWTAGVPNYQISGTPGGAGTYAVAYVPGTAAVVAGSSMTEKYSILTVSGSSNLTGTLANGQCINDATISSSGYCTTSGGTILANTYVNNYLSGVTGCTAWQQSCTCTGTTCQNSTWLLCGDSAATCSETGITESMVTAATDVILTNRTITGSTINTERVYLEENSANYDNGSSITWATGAGATAMGWTQSQQATAGSAGAAGGSTAWEGSYISYFGGGGYDPVGFMNTYTGIYNNYAQWQLHFDVDLGLWPATQKAAFTSWAASADYPFQFIDVFSDTTTPIASGLSPTSANCDTTPHVYTSNTTYGPSYCLREDIYVIGPAGTSTAGNATDSGATGASGGFCGVQGITTDAGTQVYTITAPAAGSGSEATVTAAASVSGGSSIITSGTIDAEGGGNASGITGGAVGTQSCNASIVGNGSTALTAKLYNFAGSAGRNGHASDGGPGGSSAGTYLTAGFFGGSAVGTGASGGGGSAVAGTNATASAATAGGGGIGSSSGGAGIGTNCASGHNAASTTSGQGASGGSGSPACTTASTTAGAGGAPSTPNEFTTFSNPCPSGFGSGAGGGGGGAATGSGGTGGSGANASGYGASGGAGGYGAGAGGAAGTSTGAGICLVGHNS